MVGILGGLAALALVLLLRPFLPALAVAGVAATLAHPLHRWATGWIRPPGLAAFVVTAAIFLLVLAPLVGVALLVGQQALAGIEWLAREAPEVLAEGRWTGTVGELAAAVGLDPAELSALLAAQLQEVANLLASRTLSFLSGLGGWLLQGGAALFTLHYLLRDGPSFVATLRWLMPLEPAQTDRLLVQAREVTHATVYGNVLVAAVQGALGGLAFWLVGLPAATLWGTIMGVLSLIPIVGPPFVWVPAAAWLLLEGEIARGVALIAVGALLISTIDNLLRALFISGRAQLHPLIVFFSVLGGIVLFGAAGVVVGPVVFVLALTLVEMARLSMGPGVPPPPGGVLPGTPRARETVEVAEGTREGDAGGRRADAGG